MLYLSTAALKHLSSEKICSKLCLLILLVLMTQSLVTKSLPPNIQMVSNSNRERRQLINGKTINTTISNERNSQLLLISQDCPLNFIDCDNGRCVKFELVNNGKDDCGNGKDERYTDCPVNQFKCSNSSKCLKFDYICDGHALTDSCPGGSDERSCFCPRILCKGHCVPKGWSGCEGYPECSRKEDELLCLKMSTSGLKNENNNQGRSPLQSQEELEGSGGKLLSDSPPPISGTKVKLSIEEVINNSLSLLSSTDQNQLLLKSLGPSFDSSSTTFPPLYHFSSPPSSSINPDSRRTDFFPIRRRNGEEEERDNVLTRPPYSSSDRRSPEASPVDSVINFFSSKNSSSSSSLVFNSFKTIFPLLLFHRFLNPV